MVTGITLLYLPIYCYGDRNDSVHVDDEPLEPDGEGAEGHVPPDLPRIVEEEAEQGPDVGHAVQDDHAVDQGPVLALGPVDDVQVDRDPQEQDHRHSQDDQDVRGVLLVVGNQTIIAIASFLLFLFT